MIDYMNAWMDSKTDDADDGLESLQDILAEVRRQYPGVKIAKQEISADKRNAIERNVKVMASNHDLIDMFSVLRVETDPNPEMRNNSQYKDMFSMYDFLQECRKDCSSEAGKRQLIRLGNRIAKRINEQKGEDSVENATATFSVKLGGLLGELSGVLSRTLFESGREIVAKHTTIERSKRKVSDAEDADKASVAKVV